MSLSVILPAKNEERVISDALESVKFADQIIVVDNASTDKTAEIAREFGAKVIRFTKKGSYSDRRNIALKQVTGDWLLFLDADERVTPLLRGEILKTTSNKFQKYTGFAIPRLNIIFGREMRHGGWWPDYNKRLFNKKFFVRWEGELHEEPTFNGDLGHLTNYMVHIKDITLSQMVTKTNKWSEVEAKLMYNAGHPPMNIVRFSTAVFREFYLRMIKQKAFLDGYKGVLYGVYQVFSRFVSYSKLAEMQLEKT